MTIKSITRNIAIGALFLVPIFPLIIANALFFPFITGKAFYFRILVELAFASWVILAFLDAKYRPKINALSIAVTAFAVVTLVADLVGVNPIRSITSNFERMEGWITIVHLWMFFIVASSVLGAESEGKRLWHRWMNTSIAVAFFVGCYGFAQYFGWAAIHQGSTRLDASLGNAEYMAIYMLLSAGLAAYLFFVARASKDAARTFQLWIYGVLAVMFSFLLYETATRGTILGLIGAIMTALFVYAVFGRGAPKKSRMVSGGIIVAIILLGIVFWLNRGDSFIQKSPVLSRLASISWNDTQTQARAYIWPMAIKGFTQRPVLGWGQENFNYIFNANYNPKMWSQEQWFDRAHDVYLDWLVASGALGLIVYLSLYVIFLISVWKSSLTLAEKSVLTGLLAGYAVHNIFVFDNLASYAFFFAVLAFASSIRSGAAKAVGGARAVSAELIEYVVAPVTVIALVFCAYFFTVRPLEANMRLIKALSACANNAADATLFESVYSIDAYVANQESREQLLACAPSVIGGQYPDTTKEAFYELAQKEIDLQVAATPNDARIYALAGSFFNQINMPTQAEKYLVRGHELSPAKQTIDFELGADYVNEGKYDQGIAILKQAYESATDNPDAASAYATALVVAGQETQAHAIFGTDPAIFQTQGMAQAYMSIKQYSKAIAIYKALVASSTDDINLEVTLAQAQYSAGLTTDAVATLRAIEKVHPEYTAQIEAAIKAGLK